MDIQENSADSVQNEGVEKPVENGSNSASEAEVLDVYEIARFWSRVEVRKQHQCWPWRYDSTKEGYGEFRSVSGINFLAHRFSYRIGNGSIERGMVIRHACDNPLCCNPNHLIQGTHQDNVADRVSRGRSARGENSGRAKLTEFQVTLMRRSPLTDAYFADRFGVDAKTIKSARDGRTWTHLK